MPHREIPTTRRTFAKGQRQSMTRAEGMIWRELRAGRLGGHKFKRQVPIGTYIADFVCFEAKLIVELDGEPHRTADQQAHDSARDAWLTSQGFRVLRFDNEAVLGNGDLVLSEIRVLLHPSPDPR